VLGLRSISSGKDILWQPHVENLWSERRDEELVGSKMSNRIQQLTNAQYIKVDGGRLIYFAKSDYYPATSRKYCSFSAAEK
jgi:hypothetical protein